MFREAKMKLTFEMVFILFIITSIIALSLIFIGLEKNVVGKTPCVDGLNRINLEGIMCEEKVYTWFGLNDKWGFLSFIPMLIFCVILIKDVLS